VLGRHASGMMKRGMLVDDNLVCKMVGERIRRPDCARGVILDGFPRTIAQAEWLDCHLRSCTSEGNLWSSKPLVVIKINIQEDELLRRLGGRRSCPSCGQVFNLQFRFPNTAEMCDFDGTKLVHRR
jgi:adenylate kinase